MISSRKTCTVNIGISTTTVAWRSVCRADGYGKHYITLIVFVKSWGFPPLQTNASYTDTLQMCECNLAFLYILNAAVGLSLCVSLQKSRTITTYLPILCNQERMNEIDCYCYYYPVRLIELLWKTIKGLTGFTFYVLSTNNGMARKTYSLNHLFRFHFRDATCHK